MTKIENAEIVAASETFAANVNARLAYEKTKSDNYDSIKSNFEKKVLKRNSAALMTFLLTNEIDLNFMNRSNNVASRLNVYACEKICKLVDHINIDEYTRCILLAARKLQANNSHLTRDDAKHVCSANNDIVKGERAALLADCRSDRLKGISTVATQHSSSLQALISCHFLTETRDDNNNEVFVLDMTNKHVKKLLAAFDKQRNN